MKTYKELTEGKGSDLHTMKKAMTKIVAKLEKYKAPKRLITMAKKLEDELWEFK